jgi:protein gp37
MASWNLWHGCRKISPGCLNCYVYRGDERYGRESGSVYKTRSFDVPVRKDRRGNWKIPAGETVFTCFTSDFLLKEADGWRPEAWAMIRARPDLDFFFITKRIHRLESVLPEDWGSGYDNVTVYSTVENQEMADFRLPILLNAPLKHKGIAAEPLPASPGRKPAPAATTGCWTSGRSASRPAYRSPLNRRGGISSRMAGGMSSSAGFSTARPAAPASILDTHIR